MESVQNDKEMKWEEASEQKKREKTIKWWWKTNENESNREISKINENKQTTNTK